MTDGVAVKVAGNKGGSSGSGVSIIPRVSEDGGQLNLTAIFGEHNKETVCIIVIFVVIVAISIVIFFSL